jgi:ribonuclease J
MNENRNKKNTSNNKVVVSSQLRSNRGQAIRAQRRTVETAHQITSQFEDASTTNVIDPKPDLNDHSTKLRIIGLGGMDGGGSKNMMLIEYGNDAIIVDCGIDLGVDLPGVNYMIADTSYLKRVKRNLRGYVITHGHLDHIGGLPYIMPKMPAPIYGSRFTLGMVEQIFAANEKVPEDFELRPIVMSQDNHERLKVGPFTIELVRVTHSIPDSTMVVIDTPVGRIINTGDFKIDPEPLDHKPTDIERLRQLGEEGVHVLLSESTTTERPGRTPTEHNLEPSFEQLMQRAPGRVFVATFSTNMNRIQMIVSAAVKNGRKVAFDGRSMMATLETAVRLGYIKIPKGALVPMAQVNTMKDQSIVIVCTGSQGEMNSALDKMSKGDHKFVKLKEQDSVILSSTPIPETGNDASVGNMVDDLMRMNVHVFRHETHELDGSGPLHVSGHASIDEYADLIKMTKPKFFVPIYGSFRSKRRHIDIAAQSGIDRRNMINAENGDVIEVSADRMYLNGHVENGSVLVDQTGAIVPNVVVKDRIVMAEDGIVTVILTLQRGTGRLLTSPDIITRGFIYMRENEELMNGIRTELKRAAAQRFTRIDIDRFKAELKDHITHFLYEHTERSPMVIPVVNVLGSLNDLAGQQPKDTPDTSHD